MFSRMDKGFWPFSFIEDMEGNKPMASKSNRPGSMGKTDLFQCLVFDRGESIDRTALDHVFPQSLPDGGLRKASAESLRFRSGY